MSGQHPAAQPNRQQRPIAFDDGGTEVLVLLGRCDEMRAEVYARLVARPSMAGAGRLALVGTLVGPRCGTATTLPTTVRWIDAAADQYGRIVLLSYGPAMGVWSRSVGGSKGARKVQIVPVRKDQGFQGNILKRRLQAALR
jgi:hypothetical protein